MENKKLTWKHYLGIAVVAVLVIYLVIGFSFSNKFFWGTKINGMNVAGKTADQVIEMFDKKANDYSLTIKERKDKTETLTSDQLRTKFEGADEIKQIKEDQGSFGWIKGLFGSEHYDNVTMYSYDTKSFTKAYKKLDAFNNKKMIKIANAKPVYKDGKFEIQKEEEGTELKKDVAAKKIGEAVKDGLSTISLDKENCYDNPEYTSDNDKLINLTKDMNKKLKGSITYKFGKQVVVLDKNTYSSWLKIKKDYSGYTVDKNAMENWVLKFMYKYNTQYGWHKFKTHDAFNNKKMIKIANAKPVYKDGKFEIQKEEEGTELKKDVAAKKIGEAVKDGLSTISLDKENCYDNPEYTSDNDKLINLTKDMNKKLKGSITYKFGKQVVVLDKNTYSSWLKIKKDYSGYTVDKNAMENWVLKFMYKYNTQYGWHKFKTHDGRTKKIYGGPYGWRISKDKEMASVKKMLANGTTETREPYWREKGKVYDGVNGDIGDTYVEVDMGAQTVYYFKKGKLKFTTSCVTGKMTADRKTPECVAYILYKQPSATLSGQGYSSDVKYWMPFIGNVGFHSAPWRGSFGGSEYISNGSHGCVNLPTYAAATLYKLVSQGDPVVTYY